MELEKEIELQLLIGYTSTWRIGLLLRQKGLMVKTRTILNVCKKLEKVGVIKKHRYSNINNSVWEIVSVSLSEQSE